MSLHPFIFIAWPASGDARVMIQTDGVCVEILDLDNGEHDDDDNDENLRQAFAVDAALKWARDPSAPMPTGWRSAQLLELWPFHGLVREPLPGLY